jgi:uncharacterized membrane protein
MWRSIRRSFDALMVLIYVCVGVFILWGSEYFNNMSPSMRIFFGILIISYGLFRLYKMIQSFRERQSDEEFDNEV